MARAKKQSTSAPGRAETCHGVPGTYRGFSLQVNRFVWHLLNAAASDTVCLEAFEDVGVETGAGPRIAEQTKSYLSHNPLADRSPALWKTLANWVQTAKDGVLEPSSTRFILYCQKSSMGTVATRLHAAVSSAHALEAIASIKSQLRYPDGLSDDAEIREYMVSVLDTDTDLLASLIVQIEIQCGSIAGTEELTERFSRELISADNMKEVIQWSHGWVKQQIDEQVATGQPCRIVKRTFFEALLNYVRTHDRLTILKSCAGTPDASAVEGERQYRVYVRQLRCVGVDDIDVLEAINDYLRAAVDRTRWSQQGYVTSASLNSLAKELTLTWRNKSRRVSAAHRSNSEEERGRILFSDCIEHVANVDGLETPKHFIRGNWHALADDYSVGWHPRFQEVLQQPPQSQAESDEKGST